MRKLLKRTLAIAVVLGMSVPAVRAAEIQANQVDKNATWVLHLDVEACREADVFQAFHAESKNTDQQPAMVSRWLEERYGVEAEDVDSVTLYGLGQETADTVAVIDTEFDEAAIRKVIEKQPKHDVTEHAGVKIYSWDVDRAESDANQPTVAVTNRTTRTARKPIQSTEKVRAAFFKDKALFASDLTSIVSAIDVIKGEKGLSENDAAVFAKLPDGSTIYGAVLKYDDPSMKQNNPMAGFPLLEGLMQDVTRTVFAVAPKDDRHAMIVVRSQIGSDDSANQVGEVFEGLRAMLNLYSAESKKSKEAAAAYSLLPELNQSGNTIEATWTVNVEQLEQMATRRIEQMDKRFDEAVESAVDGTPTDPSDTVESETPKIEVTPERSEVPAAANGRSL